jgi:type IV pilus assembly protein PilB
MGAQPFLVASSLTAAVAQRLVRRPCENCIVPTPPDEATMAVLGLLPEDLEGASSMMGEGCPECGGTGYRGRTAVYEVLVVDAAMRQILMRDATESAIAAQAQSAGMQTLRASAIAKARRGETTYEEVIRVTHTDHGGSKACPVCALAVDSDMVVCPWCTTALDRGHCGECARALDPDWRICPWCRTPVSHPAGATT